MFNENISNELFGTTVWIADTTNKEAKGEKGLEVKRGEEEEAAVLYEFSKIQIIRLSSNYYFNKCPL